MTSDTGPNLRAMSPTDWPRVSAIYQEGIATGDATFQTDTPFCGAWYTSRRLAESGPCRRASSPRTWPALRYMRDVDFG